MHGRLDPLLRHERRRLLWDKVQRVRSQREECRARYEVSDGVSSSVPLVLFFVYRGRLSQDGRRQQSVRGGGPRLC